MKRIRTSGLRVLLILPLLAALACESATDGVPSEPLVIVEGSSVEVDVGASVQLTARGGSGPASWSSSSPSVATVVPVTGFVTGVGPGEAVITATRGSQQASITVRVVRPPVMVLSAGELTLRAQVGGAASSPGTITVTNGGGGSLGAVSVAGVTYPAGGAQEWLAHQVSQGVVTLIATPGALPVGSYSANVSIAAAGAENSPRTVAVTFEVEGIPVMSAEPDPLVVTSVQGENPGPVEFSVRNTGGGTLSGLGASVSYPLGGPAWLGAATVVPTANGGTIRFTPATSALPRGSYLARVRVVSSVPRVQPLDVDVQLTVASGPVIVATPASVTFSALVGLAPPAPRAVQITNGGGGSLSNMGISVIYGSGAGWLNATIDAVTAPASINLSVNTGMLNPGTWNAAVRVSAASAENSPLEIPVTVTVAAPGVVVLNPSAIAVTTVVATVNAGPVPVSVTEQGGGTLQGISLGTPQYGAGATNWLAITQQPGPVSPTQFRVQAIAGGLTPGTYTATLPVLSSSTAPGASPAVLSVTQTVLPPSFAAEVFGPIGGGGTSSCASCHDGTPAPNFRTTAASIRSTLLSSGSVVPGNPGASNFLCRLTPGSACTHSKLTASQAERVRLWILYGANP